MSDSRQKLNKNETNETLPPELKEVKLGNNIEKARDNTVNKIEYSPIQHTINKNSLIGKTKQLIKVHLMKIKDSCIEENFIELVNNFENIKCIDDAGIQQYKNIENNGINLLKKFLYRDRRYKKSDYWTQLISFLYYLIGVSQLVQDKNIEAQIHLYECYLSNSMVDVEILCILLCAYACMNENVSIDKVIKAKWYLNNNVFCKNFKSKTKTSYSFDLYVNLLDKVNFDLTKFEAITRSEILKSDSITEKIFAKIAPKALIDGWIEEKEEEAIRILQIEILKPHTLVYLESENMAGFFIRLIINEINKFFDLKNHNQSILVSYRVNVLSTFIAASKYIHVKFIIKNIIQEIIAVGKSDLIAELKIILCELMDQLKITDLQYISLYNKFDIHTLSQLVSTPAYNHPPFVLPITTEQFIFESKKITEEIFLDQKDLIQTEDCKNFVNSFFKKNNSKKLYQKCESYIIDKIFIDHNSLSEILNNYGSSLEVLCYITGMSKLSTIKDQTQLLKAVSYFSEGAYHASNPKIKDLHLLAQAFIYLKCQSFSQALYVLDEMSSLSIDMKLKKEMIDQLIKYQISHHIINFRENDEIKKILNDLELCVSNNRFQEAFRLRDRYESIEEKYRFNAHFEQQISFHFLITLLFFQLRNQTVNKNKKVEYAKNILVYLNETLRLLPNILSGGLLRFKDAISKMYGKDDKTFIKLFDEDYTNLILDADFGDEVYNSLTFHQIVADYCAHDDVLKKK